MKIRYIDGRRPECVDTTFTIGEQLVRAGVAVALDGRLAAPEPIRAPERPSEASPAPAAPAEPAATPPARLPGKPKHRR